MNLEDIQPWIASLIRGNPELAGVPVLLNDGTYPKIPDRESALKTMGLSLLVWQIDSDGLLDVSPTGVCVETISIQVLIEENAAICRGISGAGIQAEKALRLVRKSIIGKRATPSAILLPQNPPFKHFGNTNGLTTIVCSFQLVLPIDI